MSSVDLLEQRIALLERRLTREQKARRQAETILELKSLQLYQSEEQLRLLNHNLAEQVSINQEHLRKSENRYRQLIESVEDIIYKISPDGYFTFVNPVVEQYLGYTECEVIGLHFLELVRPDYRASLLAFYQDMIRTRQPSSYQEFPALSKDGRTVWIGQTVRWVDADPIAPELVAVARDITQRKRTEDALLTTQARLESLISNLQTGVLVEDENRNIILVNHLYCQLFGIRDAPGTLVGKNYLKVAMPPATLFADPELITQQLDEAVHQKRVLVKEVTHLVDGRIIEWDYIPIWLTGQYRGHLWQYRDITEQYQADEQIRKSEEKYRGIMNNLELGLLEVDTNQIIRQAYNKFCYMVGYTEDELLGRYAPDLLLTDDSRAFMLRQRSLQEGTASSYELELVRKGGQPIWTLVSGAPIFDEQGAVKGAMVIHYEITERKRLEQELALAKQVAEEARYTEKQFLANMSHEIRTPLNAIVGFSNLLETTALLPEQQDYVGFVRTAGKNLLAIVNDILDISKIEAGMLSLESIPFSIFSLADSIRTMLQATATDKRLQLIVETDPALPAQVLGDPTRLTQILVNLLSNAIKFTQHGVVTVQINKQAETAESVWVRFTVQDTGIGMAADILPHIFERFRQASDFTTRYYGGTGLGLNIVRSLAEIQGGWVSVSSTLGEGSCFTVEIPYQVAPNRVDPIAEGTLLPDPKTRELTILVVEDNLMNQKLALQVLKRLGYRTQLAENGQQALDRLQEQDFDLILMDIQMPVMDGYTTTRHIRNTLGKTVPIIAMTAHALASEREQCLQIGMNDFVPKPFQMEELQRVIQKYTAAAPPVASMAKPVSSGSTSASCFSLDTLLRSVDNDRAFARELLALFVAQTPIEIQQIQQAVDQQDVATIGRLIHAQKGPILFLALTTVSQLGLTLESRVAEQPSMAEIKPLIDQYVMALNAQLPTMQLALAHDLV